MKRERHSDGDVLRDPKRNLRRLNRRDDLFVPDWGDEYSDRRDNNRVRRAADKAAIRKGWEEWLEEEQDG